MIYRYKIDPKLTNDSRISVNGIILHREKWKYSSKKLVMPGAIEQEAENRKAFTERDTLPLEEIQDVPEGVQDVPQVETSSKKELLDKTKKELLTILEDKGFSSEELSGKVKADLVDLILLPEEESSSDDV